jgi:DNA-binding transcriptional regulator LsrR (DeoR family)
MAKLEEQIRHIEYLDQLIRFRATGNPEQLAKRLNISQASLFRLLDAMKHLNAPIKYDIYLQSYVYEKEVRFKFGFYTTEITPEKAKEINGGYTNLKFLINF